MQPRPVNQDSTHGQSRHAWLISYLSHLGKNFNKKTTTNREIQFEILVKVGGSLFIVIIIYLSIDVYYHKYKYDIVNAGHLSESCSKGLSHSSDGECKHKWNSFNSSLILVLLHIFYLDFWLFLSRQSLCLIFLLPSPVWVSFADWT